MEKPCKENYTKVPNNLLDKLINQSLASTNEDNARLTQTELYVLLYCLRMILGYSSHRKARRRPLSCRYIAKRLGLHFSNVAKAIKNLAKRGYLQVENGKGDDPTIIVIPVDFEMKGVVDLTTGGVVKVTTGA
jgi:DNA-binding MarR family transcriptional regulator